MIRKIISAVVCLCFAFQTSGAARAAELFDLSGHVTSVFNSILRDKYRPLHMRSVELDPYSDRMTFLLDTGDDTAFAATALDSSARSLLGFFATGVRLPNEVFWVNLHPFEQENIIDPALEGTELGRVLLEADLLLKKETARLLSDQTPSGREYWQRVLDRAREIFRSDGAPLSVSTRMWIVPDEIIIRETADRMYVYKATLQVKLEQDYASTSGSVRVDPDMEALNEDAAAICREVILPKLTHEVNVSRAFAPLRQAYYSLIIAQWFKQRRSDIGAIAVQADEVSADSRTWQAEDYFSQYASSYQDGEYHFSVQGAVEHAIVTGGVEFAALLPSVPLPAYGHDDMVTVTLEQGGTFTRIRSSDEGRVRAPYLLTATIDPATGLSLRRETSNPAAPVMAQLTEIGAPVSVAAASPVLVKRRSGAGRWKSVALSAGVMAGSLFIPGFSYAHRFLHEGIRLRGVVEQWTYANPADNTLWGIARDILRAQGGSEPGRAATNNLVLKMQAENPWIKNPDVIRPGDEIVIPQEYVTPDVIAALAQDSTAVPAADETPGFRDFAHSDHAQISVPQAHAGDPADIIDVPDAVAGNSVFNFLSSIIPSMPSETTLITAGIAAAGIALGWGAYRLYKRYRDGGSEHQGEPGAPREGPVSYGEETRHPAFLADERGGFTIAFGTDEETGDAAGQPAIFSMGVAPADREEMPVDSLEQGVFVMGEELEPISPPAVKKEPTAADLQKNLFKTWDTFLSKDSATIKEFESAEILQIVQTLIQQNPVVKDNHARDMYGTLYRKAIATIGKLEEAIRTADSQDERQRIFNSMWKMNVIASAAKKFHIAGNYREVISSMAGYILPSIRDVWKNAEVFAWVVKVLYGPFYYLSVGIRALYAMHPSIWIARRMASVNFNQAVDAVAEVMPGFYPDTDAAKKAYDDSLADITKGTWVSQIDLTLRVRKIFARATPIVLVAVTAGFAALAQAMWIPLGISWLFMIALPNVWQFISIVQSNHQLALAEKRLEKLGAEYGLGINSGRVDASLARMEKIWRTEEEMGPSFDLIIVPVGSEEEIEPLRQAFAHSISHINAKAGVVFPIRSQFRNGLFSALDYLYSAEFDELRSGNPLLRDIRLGALRILVFDTLDREKAVTHYAIGSNDLKLSRADIMFSYACQEAQFWKGETPAVGGIYVAGGHELIDRSNGQKSEGLKLYCFSGESIKGGHHAQFIADIAFNPESGGMTMHNIYGLNGNGNGKDGSNGRSRIDLGNVGKKSPFYRFFNFTEYRPNLFFWTGDLSLKAGSIEENERAYRHLKDLADIESSQPVYAGIPLGNVLMLYTRAARGADAHTPVTALKPQGLSEAEFAPVRTLYAAMASYLTENPPPQVLAHMSMQEDMILCGGAVPCLYHESEYTNPQGSSSPLGGIDFRNLDPAESGSVGSATTGSVVSDDAFSNLRDAVDAFLSSGHAPSPDVVVPYIQGLVKRGQTPQARACVADILRLEEEQNQVTGEELKALLVSLDKA